MINRSASLQPSRGSHGWRCQSGPPSSGLVHERESRLYLLAATVPAGLVTRANCPESRLIQVWTRPVPHPSSKAVAPVKYSKAGVQKPRKKVFHSVLFHGKLKKTETTRISKTIYVLVMGKTESFQQRKPASYRNSRPQSFSWQPRPVLLFQQFTLILEKAQTLEMMGVKAIVSMETVL